MLQVPLSLSMRIAMQRFATRQGAQPLGNIGCKGHRHLRTAQPTATRHHPLAQMLGADDARQETWCSGWVQAVSCRDVCPSRCWLCFVRSSVGSFLRRSVSGTPLGAADVNARRTCALDDLRIGARPKVIRGPESETHMLPAALQIVCLTIVATCVLHPTPKSEEQEKCWNEISAQRWHCALRGLKGPF